MFESGLSSGYNEGSDDGFISEEDADDKTCTLLCPDEQLPEVFDLLKTWLYCYTLAQSHSSACISLVSSALLRRGLYDPFKISHCTVCIKNLMTSDGDSQKALEAWQKSLAALVFIRLIPEHHHWSRLHFEIVLIFSTYEDHFSRWHRSVPL